MKRGDHIVVDRGMYQHHGIYCGNNRVIHYSGLANGLESGPVVVTGLKSFSNDSECRVIPSLLRVFDVESTIRRARSRLGENRYNLLTNNCEHFVNWCIYGTATSGQVSTVFKVLATISKNPILEGVASLIDLVGTLEPLRQNIVENVQERWDSLLFDISNSVENAIDSNNFR